MKAPSITKREWNKANNEAIRILHTAWMDVSGQGSKSMFDRASATLAHAKTYLLLQTYAEVAF